MSRSDADADAAPRPSRSRTRRTRRLNAAVAASVVAGAAGMVTGTPAVLLSSIVGVGYAAYARTGGVPDATVTVERTATPTSPAPGEDVSVRLTVRNEGPRTIPDCRVADGVPDDLSVVDGDATAATALRPDESIDVEYDVRARRGEHGFGPATVAIRGASGAAERVIEVDPGTELRCLAVPEASSPAAAGGLRAGRVATDAGGSGVEFHATREYRPGDPMRRIDWNRLARRGELTTVEFREERSARVVLVVDARAAIDRAATPADPGAVDLAVHAADQARRAFAADGHRVGLAVLGDPPNGTDALAWLAPDDGRVHRARLRAALRATAAGGVDPGAPVASAMERPRVGRFEADADGAADDATHPDGSGAPDRPLAHLFDGPATADAGDADGGDADAGDAGDDAEFGALAAVFGDADGGDDRPVGRTDGGAVDDAARARAATLRNRIAGEAHVVVVSPVLDDLPAALYEELAAVGHPVSVVSPDVTADGTAGEKLAGMERADRLAALRRRGAGVGDWTPGDPVSLSLLSALEAVDPDAGAAPAGDRGPPPGPADGDAPHGSATVDGGWSA